MGVGEDESQVNESQVNDFQVTDRQLLEHNHSVFGDCL